ncbi:MAG: RNA polymerase sigma factor [Flavisolibacter sp.]
MAFLRNISNSAAPDAELVALYKKTRDLNVLGELFQRYMDLTYGVCLKYLKHPENAQDSVSAIFEELVAKLHKHEVENFRPWLYTLAKNHCLMRLRSEKKQTTVNFDIELVQSEENVHLNGSPDGSTGDREEDFRNMEQCMELLPPEQKQVIGMFYLEGKCYNEISQVTGLEWNKVRSYIQNGRRNLKLCMENQQEKPITENGPVRK